MLSITRSQVPIYLTSGSFYNSLNADDTTEFSVPSVNFKPDPAVNSVEELSHMLHTLQYWGVSRWHMELFGYLMLDHSDEVREQVNSIIGEFESHTKLLDWCKIMFTLKDINSKDVNEVWNEINQSGAVPRLISGLLSENNEAIILVLNFVTRLRPVKEIRCHMLSCIATININDTIVDSNANLAKVAELLNSLFAAEPPVELVLPCFPLLLRLLSHPWPDERKTAALACKAIITLLSISDEHIRVVVHSELTPKLVQHLSNGPQSALFAVYNIMMRREHHQTVFELNPLPALFTLLLSPERDMCRFTCSVIAHFARGTVEQKQAVIDTGIHNRVIELTQVWNDDVVLTELLGLLLTITIMGSTEQMKYMLDSGIITLLLSFLTTPHMNTLYVTISGIYSIIQQSDSVLFEVIMQQIVSSGGHALIRDIAKSEEYPAKITDVAVQIINRYFHGFVGEMPVDMKLVFL